MNNTLIKILQSREDLSDYLFHFTKGRNALLTLKTIISDKGVKDVNNCGYICFTEAPVTMLSDMFKIFMNYDKPMFAPYGVGLKKSYLHKLGARPVIYSDLSDFDKLKSIGLAWRFEEYSPNIHNFSWLREWRIPLKEIELTSENSIVITSKKEEKEILMDFNGNIDFDGCIEDGEFHGYALGDFLQTFKHMSIDEIDEYNNLSKFQLEQIISSQNLDEIETRNLGCF